MNGQIPPSTDSVYGTLSSATWVPKLGGGGGRERTLTRVGGGSGGGRSESDGRRFWETTSRAASDLGAPSLLGRTDTHTPRQLTGTSMAHPWTSLQRPT